VLCFARVLCLRAAFRVAVSGLHRSAAVVLMVSHICGGMAGCGPSKGRKTTGACGSAACARAADNSQAAAESVWEGVCRPQPPSPRGRLSCISAVHVAKGLVISPMARWIARAASLTEASMLPARACASCARVDLHQSYLK
jgi:hypothetical protein